MELTDQYPARVTIGSDGIRRWSREVNLRQDHAARDQFKKAILIVCGSVCALMLIMMIAVGDLSMAWIPVACCGFVLLISIPIFKLYRSQLRDRFTVAYEMNEEAILAIWDPAVQQQMNNTALIVTLLSAASGHPLQGIGYGAAASASSQPVLTRFRSVRNIRENRALSRIDLQMVPAPRFVWAPAEDYDMILDFIRSHVSESNQRWNPLG